jgi:hypothetical protein
MTRLTTIALALAALAFAHDPAVAVSSKSHPKAPLLSAPLHHASAPASDALHATGAALRDLWLEHAFWVRSVVVARQNANDGAETAAEAAVVANAQAIAAAIEPFYGVAARDRLFQLLAGHYGAVKAYLDAAQQSSDSGQAKALDALLANAAEIATFLSGANPHLPHEAVLGLLETHGAHHVGQIEHVFGGEYTEEAGLWGEMTRHMYVIADALAGALAAQFPERF